MNHQERDYLDSIIAERDEARRACEKAIRERRSLEIKEDDWHTAYERSEARVTALEAEIATLKEGSA